MERTVEKVQISKYLAQPVWLLHTPVEKSLRRNSANPCQTLSLSAPMVMNCSGAGDSNALGGKICFGLYEDAFHTAIGQKVALRVMQKENLTCARNGLKVAVRARYKYQNTVK